VIHRRFVAHSSPSLVPPLTDGAQRLRPRLLAVVCLLVLFEAAGLAGVGIAFGAELVRGTSVPGAAAFLAAFMLGAAAVLVVSARGLWRGRRWSRSPVLTGQLLLVVLALGWLGVALTWWGFLVLVVALVVGVGLVLPPVVAATIGTGRGRETDSPGTTLQAR
jgi:hypothetical protein